MTAQDPDASWNGLGLMAAVPKAPGVACFGAGRPERFPEYAFRVEARKLESGPGTI